MGKVIDAAEFEKNCLLILDEVQATGEPVTVTKRGRIVGVLNPPEPPVAKKRFTFGCMKGSVLKYDRPFDPAVPDEEIYAAQGSWGPVD